MGQTKKNILTIIKCLYFILPILEARPEICQKFRSIFRQLSFKNKMLSRFTSTHCLRTTLLTALKNWIGRVQTLAFKTIRSQDMVIEIDFKHILKHGNFFCCWDTKLIIHMYIIHVVSYSFRHWIVSPHLCYCYLWLYALGFTNSKKE